MMLICLSFSNSRNREISLFTSFGKPSFPCSIMMNVTLDIVFKMNYETVK